VAEARKGSMTLSSDAGQGRAKGKRAKGRTSSKPNARAPRTSGAVWWKTGGTDARKRKTQNQQRVTPPVPPARGGKRGLVWGRRAARVPAPKIQMPYKKGNRCMEMRRRDIIRANRRGGNWVEGSNMTETGQGFNASGRHLAVAEGDRGADADRAHPH